MKIENCKSKDVLLKLKSAVESQIKRIESGESSQIGIDELKDDLMKIEMRLLDLG